MIRVNSNCRMCSSEDLKLIIALGSQPLANRFLREEELGDEEFRAPLDVYWCANCNLVQLGHVVDKSELYRNYIYFSSGMPKLSDHFSRYATNVMERYLNPGDLVVEIASNDGILLKWFQARNYNVLGVEPALNVAARALENGVPTITEFFSTSVAADIVSRAGRAQCILSNNVVAHIDDHQDLARGVKNLLAPDGIWVIEAPHLLDMFENLAYDTIYHEHLSYLAIRPMMTWLAGHDLEIIDVEIHQVQGQSLRAYVGHSGRRTPSPKVAALVGREVAYGMDNRDAYETLAKRIESSKDRLVSLLHERKAAGRRIAGYGAPAKGNTLLNYCNIGATTLDFALEDLPSKQGMFTPGMHIPTRDRAYAVANEPDDYLLLAWNYEKPILEKESTFRKRGGRFIIPIGDDIRLV